MADCTQCADYEWCAKNEECGMFKPKPITNYDLLRSKSVEELAEFMANNVGCDDCRFFATCRSAPQDRACAEKWLDWLKQEVDDG